MGHLRLLLSLAMCTVVIYAAQLEMLKNSGSFSHVNTTLQAISLISAASNIILTVDPKTLPEKKSRDTLLQLQTILYTLRTKGIILKGAYVVDFLKNVHANFPEEWNTTGPHDASSFYKNLVQTIEKNLLPGDKRATFHDLLNVRQEITSASGSTTEDSLVIRISGSSGKVQLGLDEYFGVHTTTTNTGTSSPQRRIVSDPSVLSIYMDPLPDSKQGAIVVPMDRIKIENYRSANLPKSIPSRYKARYEAMSCKNPPEHGHYHGFQQDGVLRITPDDSDGNVTETTAQCQEFASLLYYVNEQQETDLMREKPVPKEVMTLIEGELAKYATIGREPCRFPPESDAFKLASGLFHFLSVAVIVALLN